MPPPRRLNLLDGMIVMAGLACCFLLTRLYFDEHYLPFRDVVSRADSNLNRRFQPFDHATLVWLGWHGGEAGKFAALWLGMLGPIVLLLRVRRPRPAWAELMTQPGTVATFAATAIAGLGVVLWCGVALVAGEGPGLFFYKTEFTDFLARSGLVIAVAWINLAVGRRWAPEPSLVDRAGRCIGVSWIVISLMLAGIDFEFRLLRDTTSINPYDYSDLLRRL